MSISADTIHIELPYQSFTKLKNNSTMIDSDTGEIKFSVGYHDCIKVRKFKNKVRIEVSLPKLLKGNNIYSLSYNEIKYAIILIERKLGISIRKGIIRRIDIFLNIETDYKTENYFRYFVGCRYMALRSIVGKTSLYFKNGSREINIYDKIAKILSEIKKDPINNKLPIEFVGKNITRIENRYKNTFLIKKFGKEFTVENLFNSKIFLMLINLFIDDYNLIHTENKSIIDFSKIDSKKSLLEQLANEGIKAMGGLSEVMELIDASRPFNENIRKEYYSRRKKEVKDIANNPKFTYQGKLLEELNTKVEQAYQNTIFEIRKFM